MARCILFALAFSSTGCFLVHGRQLPRDPEPGPIVDASSGRPDAGTDASNESSPDAGICGPLRPPVAVRVETAPGGAPLRCADAFPFHGQIALLGSEDSPADDGVRIHTDMCPAHPTDASCLCDIVVSNVGPGLDLFPIGTVLADLSPTDILLQQPLVCAACVGCPCRPWGLFFFATADAPLEGTTFSDAGLTFSEGARVCAGDGRLESGTWALGVTLEGLPSVDVRAVTTASVGSFYVRALRDVYVFRPGAACLICDVPHASWVVGSIVATL